MLIILWFQRGYGGEVSLTDCFDLFTAEEVLEGDESPVSAHLTLRALIVQDLYRFQASPVPKG